MQYKFTKRKNQPKPFTVIMRCVNCDAVATEEDIKFGCARCEANDCGGYHSPKDWSKKFPDGGWYQE